MPQLITITRESGIPLIGLLHIGVLDRGSNLLQVRATTSCNMKCTFCSTAANSFEIHPYNFQAEPGYLVDAVKEVIALKNNEVTEINLDSVGEPSSYPQLIELISALKKLPSIRWISMQSNGTLLTAEFIKKLADAGLNRINLSVHSLIPEQAQYLFGSNAYNLERILPAAHAIAQSTIELNLTPVYLPGVNDDQIPELIQLSQKLNCKISIQKYEAYYYSRKEKKAKQTNWYKFYRKLEAWEQQYGVKLKLGPKDFKVYRTKKIPLVFHEHDVVTGFVLAPGWIRNEVIIAAQNRAITVTNCNKQMGQKVRAKIFETHNSIYLAKES